MLDADTKTVGQIASHLPGYIDKELEQIVGVQTDAPLKREMMPYGGLRGAKRVEAHGRTMDADTAAMFTRHRKTHNDGVFDAYTPAIRRARSAGIVTGLPDGYGRGRIIGDYRRVALYGVDRLIEDKRAQHAETDDQPFSEEFPSTRGDPGPLRALGELKRMAMSYGFDISGPAKNGREAVQWTYFALPGGD